MGWSKTYNMRYHGSKFEKSFMTSFSLPIEIPIKNKLSLQPEFSFIQKGIKANLHGGYINYTEIMKLSYLEVPFLAKLNIVTTSKIKLEFILGPGMGYAINGYIYGGETDKQSYRRVNQLSFDNDMKRITLNINVGSNLQLTKKDGNIVFDIRYQHGLSNDARDNQYTSNPVFKSRGLIFSAGYMIPFKK